MALVIAMSRRRKRPLEGYRRRSHRLLSSERRPFARLFGGEPIEPEHAPLRLLRLLCLLLLPVALVLAHEQAARQAARKAAAAVAAHRQQGCVACSLCLGARASRAPHCEVSVNDRSDQSRYSRTPEACHSNVSPVLKHNHRYT